MDQITFHKIDLYGTGTDQNTLAEANSVEDLVSSHNGESENPVNDKLGSGQKYDVAGGLDISVEGESVVGGDTLHTMSDPDELTAVMGGAHGEASSVLGATGAMVQHHSLKHDVVVEKRRIYIREELIKIKMLNICQTKPRGFPSNEMFSVPIIMENANLTFLSPASWKYSKQVDEYVTVKERLESGEEFPNAEILRYHITGLLNKISNENFDDCLTELPSVVIGSEEGIALLAEEIFLRATEDEMYRCTFVRLCSSIASVDSGNTRFKSIILRNCQDMFIIPLEDQIDKMRQERSSQAKTDPATEGGLEEDIREITDRYYGNVRFIGELYLNDLLAGKVVIFCIKNLIGKGKDPNSLFSLCKLLESCGPKLKKNHSSKKILKFACEYLKTRLEDGDIDARVHSLVDSLLKAHNVKGN